MPTRSPVTLDALEYTSDTKLVTSAKTGPIEVWLSRDNLEVRCIVVHEDESTDRVKIDSLSLRGAQREITGYFISKGYKPDGRWETLVSGEAFLGNERNRGETVRRFKPPPENAS